MKNVLMKLIAIAAASAAGLTAGQAQAPAGPNRPTGVPGSFLITPFGYFHPSCVVHLAPGDELLPDQSVIRHRNGGTDNMPACAYPHYRGDGERVYGDERGIKDPNISHSWIVSESVTTSSSYGFLSAQWNVPPPPASNNGQVLYYFPGLEDINDVVTILQPVLGWNSDYASAWGIASWNCCVKGTSYEATPQPVKPGDTILGYLHNTCSAGIRICASWDVVTWDLHSGNYSELLNTSNFRQTFNWAFGGVLEVYHVHQCSDYPNNPNGLTGGTYTMSFNAITLYENHNGNLVPVIPSWTFNNWASRLTPQCSYDGSTPQQIILHY
jgi:hypothetical protein